MNWMMLIVAGFFEAGFATCLAKARITNGNTSMLWWSGFAVCLTVSMYLLYLATKSIPVGTAYAVWTGTGAAVTVIAGIIFFNEPAELKRMLFLVLLIVAIAGLKISEK